MGTWIDMTDESPTISKPRADTSRVTRQSSAAGSDWAAYAACVWAFLFAGLTFYWIAGGTAGVSTIGEAITGPATSGDRAMQAVLWLTGVLKIAAGILALALARRWERARLRLFLLALAWIAAAILLFWGAVNWIEFALMDLGVLRISASLGTRAVRWHLLLWEPIFIIGGALFSLAAYRFRRRTSAIGR